MRLGLDHFDNRVKFGLQRDGFGGDLDLFPGKHRERGAAVEEDVESALGGDVVNLLDNSVKLLALKLHFGALEAGVEAGCCDAQYNYHSFPQRACNGVPAPHLPALPSTVEPKISLTL